MVETTIGINHGEISVTIQHLYAWFQTKWGYTQVRCAKFKKKIKNRDVATQDWNALQNDTEEFKQILKMEKKCKIDYSFAYCIVVGYIIYLLDIRTR